MVYPNPTKNLVHLEITGNFEQEIIVKITDVAGRLLLEDIISTSKGITIEKIDMSTFDSGLYRIILENEIGKLKTFNIIKMD